MKKIFYTVTILVLINPLYAQWNQQYSQSTHTFYEIDLNGLNGYTCGGRNEVPLDAEILRTTNGGESWTQVPIPYGLFLTSITAYGFAVGSNYVLRTTNSGNTWTKYDFPTAQPRALSFYDFNTGYIVGHNGTILKTTDRGLNYSNQSVNNTINLKAVDVKYNDPFTAMACGANGVIVKTTNGGANWVNIVSPTTETLNSIVFLSNNLVFISGNNGLIFRSTNGGANFTQQLSNTTVNLYEIEMVTLILGYACGENGTIVKTFNGGNNWYLINTLPQADVLWSISARDINRVHSCGTDGFIMYTTNGGGAPIGIEPVGNETPDNFSLSQNYPNPFNPATNIEFSIAKSTSVKIAVYDLLGREVSVLTDGFLNAGEYKVTWDGSNASSGTYFYKIITNEFTDTRKMILIK